MPESDVAADRLLVMRQSNHAIVRLVGRGTFKNSGVLKDFAVHALEAGDTSLLIDLGACSGMDSTFMGVIAGLAMRLRKTPGGRVTLANVSDRLSALLSTLGLNLLVRVIPAGQRDAELSGLLNHDEGLTAIAPPATPGENTAALMLEAHENLVKASPDNLPKFKNVLDFLREDVARKSPPTDWSGS